MRPRGNTADSGSDWTDLEDYQYSIPESGDFDSYTCRASYDDTTRQLDEVSLSHDDTTRNGVQLRYKVVLAFAIAMSVFAIVFIAVLLGMSNTKDENETIIVSMGKGDSQELFFGEKNSLPPSISPTVSDSTSKIFNDVDKPISTTFTMFQNFSFVSIFNSSIPTIIISKNSIPSVPPSSRPTSVPSRMPSVMPSQSIAIDSSQIPSHSQSFHAISNTLQPQSIGVIKMSSSNPSTASIYSSESYINNASLTFTSVHENTTLPTKLVNNPRITFAVTSGFDEDTIKYKENLSKLASMDFFIHLGNWNKNIPNCTSQSYKDTASLIKSLSPIPTFMTIGSNEINKCESATSSWQLWQKYFGQFDQYWDHASLYQTEYQDDNVANYAFEYKNVLLISLFLVELIDTSTWINTWNTVMQMNQEWIQYHTQSKRKPNVDYDTLILLSNYNRFSFNGINFNSFLEELLDNMQVNILWINADDERRMITRQINVYWKVVSIGDDIWQVKVNDQNSLEPFEFHFID